MKKTNITCTKKTRGRRRKRMGTSAATSLCKNHNNTIHESERKKKWRNRKGKYGL